MIALLKLALKSILRQCIRTLLTIVGIIAPGSLISGWCPRMGGQLGVNVRVEV